MPVTLILLTHCTKFKIHRSYFGIAGWARKGHQARKVLLQQFLMCVTHIYEIYGGPPPQIFGGMALCLSRLSWSSLINI